MSNGRESPSTPHGEGIYVASRVKHAPVWLDYRDRKGWPIVSTWIDEAGDGETADFGELWQRIRAEIGRSKVLVFYADGNEDFPFKGALVEVGMALAMGKPVFAVLDRVMIEGRTMRPVGSWLRDRNVRKFEFLPQAMEAALQLTPIAKSETSTPDPFTLQCAEELFGCHFSPVGRGEFMCAICEEPINVLHWVTAKHADDCFINQVRAYLAKHKPECVPGVEAK